MDVRKWLQDTVGPGLPATLTLPPGRDAREEPAQQDDRISSHQTRRCTHLFSDGSFLHVDRTDNGQGFSAHRPDHIGRPRRRSLEEDRPTAAPSDASDPLHSEHGDPYARRPRHKTRPEIYQPGPGVDTEKTRRRRKKEKEGRGKKASRSRRRDGKDKPPHQTHIFQPKNVTRERLTMKPNESIGLFKKGRASTPIRGRGLPDLVFSEMRFLQKRDDTKEKPQEETRNKRKRNDSNHVSEHDISAYFGARRPPLVDKYHNVQRRRSGHRSKSASPNQRPVSRASTRLGPTMELPDKPYLGFGSRGDPVASDPTYYIPWSESVRNVSVQPSEAPLPPMSSRRPHVQDTRAKELNGDCGSSAPGKGQSSRQAGQVAMHIESRDGPIEAIPRSVERREQNPILVERSAPSTSKSKVTVPDGEPRLVNQGRRSTGHIEGSIMSADRGQEIDFAVEGAGKLHEQGRPVSDHSVPDRQESRICEKNAHSLIAEATENDRERVQRSLSPLDRLLRACDNACKEYHGRDKPSVEKAVFNPGRIEEFDEPYHPSMPQRWASGGIPGRPTFYERQWPRDDFGDYAGDDFDMDNCIDVSAGGGTREVGWMGNGTDVASVRNSGYGDGLGEWPGAGNGVVGARDDVEEPQWSWRRHKLY